MKHVWTTPEIVAATSRSHVRHQIASGRWQRPAHGVIVTHNGLLSRHDQITVAITASPTSSAVSGLTALELDGLEGFDSPAISITMPNGGRKPTLAGTVFHQSTLLGEDIHPARTPRRTTVERSIIDAASWTKNPRHARAIAIASIQQGLTTPGRLGDTLKHRGPVKNKALVMESALDAAGGIQSLPERDFTWIWKTLHLPTLTRQERRVTPRGMAFLDAHCAELDMSVEIHGIPHHDIEHWDRDLVRSNELVIAGARHLVFSSYSTRHEKVLVADQLVRMAHACGWSGPPFDPDTFKSQIRLERRNFRRRAS